MLLCSCGKPALYKIKYYIGEINPREEVTPSCKDCIDKKTDSLLTTVESVHVFDVTDKYIESVTQNI
mgnify:CR=1 FL=1